MGEGLKRAFAAAKKSKDAIKEAKRLARIQAAEEARALFHKLLRREGLPIPEHEWRFDAEREWRADYCWPSARLILEVEGGVWTGGRHTRGAGFMADMVKYNRMTELGFRLLRTTPSGLHDLGTIALIKRTLTGEH
jgi:very-short-patch-repair endonuclease